MKSVAGYVQARQGTNQKVESLPCDTELVVLTENEDTTNRLFEYTARFFLLFYILE